MEDFNFLPFLEKISEFDCSTYQYFHQLFHNRTIILNEEITEDLLESVILPLQDFEKDDSQEPVRLIINTPGGSVSDGLVLCTIINQYSKPLEIIVPSYSCSMGTIILCSGNKNPNVTKKAYPFSFFLFHSGQTAVGGETSSVDDIIDFNRALDRKIRDYVVKNTNISDELYERHYRKQWYITADEALEFGLIDEIIGSDD